MPITLGTHLFSFPLCTTEEAARITRVLGMDVMDLGNGRDLDPEAVAENVGAAADRVNAIAERTGVRFHDGFPQPTDKHITNTPDEQEYRHQREVTAGWIAFGAQIGLNGITLSPGMNWPGLSLDQAYARTRDQLRPLVDIAGEHGLALRIEPHVESCIWSPDLALRMLDDVPGLSLTIDHSHFAFHGFTYEETAVMHPHGTHWHARQAALGKLQTGFDDGAIDFRRIVGDLVAGGYEGVVALEVVHTPWLDLDQQDIISETVRLRDHLRELLTAAAASGGSSR